MALGSYRSDKQAGEIAPTELSSLKLYINKKKKKLVHVT